MELLDDTSAPYGRVGQSSAPSDQIEEGYAVAFEVPERCVGTWFYLNSGVSEPVSSINISYGPDELVGQPGTVIEDEPQIPVCIGNPQTPTSTTPDPPPAAPSPTDDGQPPATTAQTPPEDQPEEPDLGLVKAAVTVVELALSSEQTGDPVEGATLKLLQPSPDLPSGEGPDSTLTSAENYKDDVPAASLGEDGTATLQLSPSEDNGEEVELALVEEEEETESSNQPASASSRREVKIDTSPSRQMVLAGSKPMTGLPASLAPTSAKICIKRGFRIGPTPVFVVKVPEIAVPAFTESLERSEAISWFEPDPCRQKEFSDPLFKSKGLWGQKFDNQWAIKRVGYDVGKSPLQSKPTDNPVTVAIIDTGITGIIPTCRTMRSG